MAFSRNFFHKVTMKFHTDQYVFTFRKIPHHLKTSLNTRSISWMSPEDATNNRTISLRKTIETSSSSRRFLTYFNDRNKTSAIGSAFEQRAAFTEISNVSRKSFLTTRRVKIATLSSRNFSKDSSDNEVELPELVDDMKQLVKTDHENFTKEYQMNVELNAVCENLITECEKLLAEYEKITEENRILKETVQVLREANGIEEENDPRVAEEDSLDTLRRRLNILQQENERLKRIKKILELFVASSDGNPYKAIIFRETSRKLRELSGKATELQKENLILEDKISVLTDGEMDEVPLKMRLELLQASLFNRKNFDNIRFIKDPTQPEEEK